MSIASELNRIINAKGDIIHAIEGKGVTVPAGKKIDELAPYINDIKGGGGTDISDADAAVSDVLTGKTFYSVEEPRKTGTMPNRGAASTDITTKAQEVTIQDGYHNGSGVVKIAAAEQAKIIADNIKKDVVILGITGTLEAGGTAPSTNAGSIFTGATIPLTYKDNTTTYENEYVYESATHNITIDGLAGRATITGNGTKSVKVVFDVTSATSSLKNFTITCVKDAQTLVYNGMHAHYGTTVTGILTFAYTNITKDGSEGTIGTNYLFIVTNSTILPIFASTTTLWYGIYSHQVLNVLIGNYSSTSIGARFLNNCFAFNQPLTLPSGVTSIGDNFLLNCYAFNQLLTLPSGITSIGASFLQTCFAFNQPITIPSGITSIGTSFLNNCYCLSVITYNPSVYPTDNNSLSQNINSKTSADGAGIIVYGTNRAGLIAALPDRTATPFRKLINGGS